MRYVTIEDCETVERDTKTEGRIPDSEPVIWDGEMTTFGHLSGNERMMVSLNIDGVLEGGNPF